MASLVGLQATAAVPALEKTQAGRDSSSGGVSQKHRKEGSSAEELGPTTQSGIAGAAAAEEAVDLNDGSRPLASKGSSAVDDNKANRSDSLGASLARALIGSMAFLFKRPVRLFRPTKLSSWNVLESMAKREGRTLSLRYMRMLLRREKSSFLPHLLLPPLFLNTLIGFTLFESYSLTEASLLRRFTKQFSGNSSAYLREGENEEPMAAARPGPAFSPLWIVTVSGAVAGAAQCFISAPLDNVRIILQTPVQTTSRGRNASNKLKPRSSTLSWRAIARAAVLPFAPAVTRDKLVQQISEGAHHGGHFRSAVKGKGKAGAGGSSWVDQIMSSDSRRQWENRLRRWRGGVHGAGLVMSLARDSLGFASFFVVFEVSRRAAYHASIWVDRIQAMVSSAPTLPSGSQALWSVTSPWQFKKSSDEFHTNEVQSDLSFESSRTVAGRVVAATVLIVGGAVGAALYELAGRPFELARVVIWEGRKAWEEGRRRNGSAAKRDGSVQHGRTARTGARVHVRRIRQSRVLRSRADSMGDRSTRIQSIVRAQRPRHPLRSRHEHGRSSGASISLKPSSKPRQWNRQPSLPPLETRPSAYGLLVEHALRTAEADQAHQHARGFLSKRPQRPLALLLLHTFFIKPFAVAHTPGEGMERIAAEQVDKSSPPSTAGPAQSGPKILDPTRAALRNWTGRNSVSSSILSHFVSSPHSTTGRKSRPRFGASTRALGTRKGPTISASWANGRLVWALKRLATPYGIGFVVFSYLGGDG